MAIGGKREGAGRKKGVRNKRTRELIEECAKTGETPLQYMLRVMNDSKQPNERRDKMAIHAARFVHPTIATIQGGDPEKPLRVIDETNPMDLARRVAFILAKGAAASEQ